MSLPSIKVVCRERDGIGFVSGPFHINEAKVQYTANKFPAETQAAFSRDGTLCAFADSKSIKVVKLEDESIISEINHPNVFAVDISPKGTYVVTWQKPGKKGTPEASVPNLIVWDMFTGKEQIRFFQKEHRPSTWPSIKWTANEAKAARMVTNEVHIYNGGSIADGIETKIRCERVQEFELSPTEDDLLLAAYSPIKKDVPASVKIFDVSSGTVKATKSFFKSEDVVLRWSPDGKGILIQTTTDMDQSGKAYYGESGLHYLRVDGSFQGTVSFNNNPGPVQDAQWDHDGKAFLVLQGLQPAQATLFKAETCTPILSFGAAPRNTIRFSPQGRFVCLGGFGNLAGDMDFWDLYKKKKIGTCKDLDGAKSFEWTPDGRAFVTAVLRPWRRVDNGFKVWSYAAELIHHEKVEELWQAMPRPALPDVFPNRPQSPRLSDKRKIKEREKAEKAAAAKKKAYVPPALRNKKTSGPSLAEKMKAERLGRVSQQAKKVVAPGTVAKPAENQGMSKAQKARERKKRAAERRREEEEAKKKQEEAEKKAEDERKAQELAAKQASMTDTEKNQKRAKAIKKKLRQIDTLKLRQKEGEELDDAALKKLSNESDLRKELASLKL